MCCKANIFLVLSVAGAAFGLCDDEPECADGDNISKDVLAFLKSVDQGLGFYHGLPYIGYLTADNFDRTVLNSPTSWVIEFYQSWCGFCLRYSVHFKRFAKDLYEWQPVSKVAAVDCNTNTPLCRRFGVIHVPSIKYFPPHFNGNYKDVLKLDQRKGKEPRKTPAQLRARIVEELKNRPDLPMLQLYTGGLVDLWDSLPVGYDWAVAVTSCSDSPTLGQELLLDYWHTKSVIIVPVPCTSSQLIADLQLPTNNFTSLYILNRGQEYAENPLLNSQPVDREKALRDLKTYFSSFHISVPAPFDPNSIPDLNITKRDVVEYAKEHSQGTIPFPHSGIVYQVDIEAAIDHSIRQELGGAQEIEGEAYQALVNYLELMKKYFPTVENGKLLFKCLFSNLANKGMTTGLEVVQTYESCVETNKPVYLDQNNGWLGCRGTLRMFRGYPCSLWMMFHTLQAMAYKNQDPNPKVVLEVMIGYVKYFFACQDCAQHFLAVGGTMPHFDNIGEAVLWLSMAHNKANKRLAGDATEDPLNPKVQFPPPDVCKACHYADGSLNEHETLEFLVRMYTNVSHQTWAELKPKDMPHAAKLTQSEFIINEEEEEFVPVTTTHLWTAHSIQFTIAASLAGLALALFILICLRFNRSNPSHRT